MTDKVDNPFRQEECSKAIREVCGLLEGMGLSMIERWWTCLCIERSAEAIMGDGFKASASDFMDAVADSDGTGESERPSG